MFLLWRDVNLIYEKDLWKICLKSGIGGAKKHGGLVQSMTKQLNDWERKFENKSPDKSSIPEKKQLENKSVVNKFEEGLSVLGKLLEDIDDTTTDEDIDNTIDINKKNLRAAILEYIDDESIDEGVAEKITILIAKKSLSNAEVASKVLNYGDPDINSQVKAWVMNHIDKNLTINKLKLPAALYFVNHSDESDVAKVLRGVKDNDTVEKFAKDLFATEHPELSADVATCLLLGEFDSGLEL